MIEARKVNRAAFVLAAMSASTSGRLVGLQIIALDRSALTKRVGRLGTRQLAQILHGIDVVLGR